MPTPIVFARNVLICLRFRGALSALVEDCGRMAFHHLACDVFGVNCDGQLWHSDRAVYCGRWDAVTRSWE